MSFLSAISAAITPANQAVNAFQQGRQDRQKVQEAESLRMLDQLRKAQEAQEQGDVRKATLRNIDSQIKVREAPRTPPVARNVDRLSPEGREAELDLATKLQAIRQPPAGQQAPVRGTPEYLKAIEDEERVRSRFRPPPRTAAGPSLPTAAIEKNIVIDEVDALANRAQKSLSVATKAGKDVSGRLGGIVPIPTWVRQTGVTGQGSDEAITTQNAVGDLVSTIGKMRSGGAITPQEFSRLEKFLPTDNDKEHVLALKLKNLRATLTDIKEIRRKAYANYRGVPSVADAIDDEYGGIQLVRPPED